MNRPSRAQEARQNASKWESLLDRATSLLSDVSELGDSVERSKDEIRDTWEGTTRDVTTVRRGVETTVGYQTDDRESDATFEESEPATPPSTVPETPSVHGDPALPAETDYEISDPVRLAELREELDEIAELPPEERERPPSFTEEAWFELHSNEFPIGEELFIETGETEGETTTEERPTERTRDTERTERRASEDRTDRSGDR